LKNFRSCIISLKLIFGWYSYWNHFSSILFQHFSLLWIAHGFSLMIAIFLSILCFFTHVNPLIEFLVLPVIPPRTSHQDRFDCAVSTFYNQFSLMPVVDNPHVFIWMKGYHYPSSAG
jgi:hypothetical protein